MSAEPQYYVLEGVRRSVAATEQQFTKILAILVQGDNQTNNYWFNWINFIRPKQPSALPTPATCELLKEWQLPLEGL